jgi:hypothetical protein
LLAQGFLSRALRARHSGCAMNKDTLLAILRHALTFVGGLAAQQGFASSDDITAGVGAVITLVGLGWSIYEKRARAAAAPAASTPPPPSTPTAPAV